MLEQFPQALKESRRWVCFDAAKTPINPAAAQDDLIPVDEPDDFPFN